MVCPLTHGNTHTVTSCYPSLFLAILYTFRIPNHLILYLDHGSSRLPWKIAHLHLTDKVKANLTIKVGHVVLLIIPAIFISEVKKNDESSASGEAEDSAESGDYQESGESEESGESDESRDFEESGESGDFEESGESGDFVESGESRDFEESEDSGDYEESGQSSDSSISKRSEIPTETQKGISHILYGWL